MYKKKKIILLLSLSLVIVSIVSFFMFTSSGEMYRDITILMSTGKKINMEGNFQELKGIEEELNSYDVYLTGEAHGTEISYKMQQYMTRYFVEEQGVRYILLEAPVSEGELLNMYLETGDTEILKNIVNKFEGSYAYNQDIYDLFKFYYDYNKRLPEDKKIYFVGIDVEHSLLLTADYFKYLIKDLGESDEKIKSMVERIKTFNNYNDALFFNDLNQSLVDNEKEYEEYLGKYYFSFKIAVRNVYSTLQGKDRDVIMAKNFQDFYEKLPKGKYFGQLGGAHVCKLIRTEGTFGEAHISTFANSINNNYKPLKGKIYSIIYIYMNSYNSLSGKEDDSMSNINTPYISGNGSVRIYTPKNNKRAYSILQNFGWKPEELGDAFFLIKDSKASPKFNEE